MTTLEFPSAPGVYMIVCKPTGDKYIGASKNLRDRVYNHLCTMRGEQGHWAPEIKALFDEHGVDAFEFSVVRECGSIEEAFDLERDLIRDLRPSLNRLVTNVPKVKHRRTALTAAQNRLMVALGEHLRANGGISPTMQELGDILGCTKVTVFEHVNELQRKGWVTRDSNQSRSLRLCGQSCPCCGQMIGTAPPEQLAPAPT